MRIAFFVCLLVFTITPTLLAESPPSRYIITGVEPMEGPDPLVQSLGRAVRIAVDPAITDAYLGGISGSAFLATVCANNCNCRDYRELTLAVDPALAALGITFEHFEKGDDACWERIKASIADGVPVVGWNPFGDFQDTLICGYDEEKDLLYGWSTKPEGKEYTTGSLSKWRGEGIFGYIVSRGAKEKIDRKKLESAQLALVVRSAHRPAIEGG
jgi:hypothetical protein